MGYKDNRLVLLVDQETLDGFLEDVAADMSVEGREGVILHRTKTIAIQIRLGIKSYHQDDIGVWIKSAGQTHSLFLATTQSYSLKMNLKISPMINLLIITIPII